LMAMIKRSVFCEFDRRENELCLYTSLIVLEETIRMVVLLLLLCHCIGNLDLECHVGASNPDCRGRFS